MKYFGMQQKNKSVFVYIDIDVYT